MFAGSIRGVSDNFRKHNDEAGKSRVKTIILLKLLFYCKNFIKEDYFFDRIYRRAPLLILYLILILFLLITINYDRSNMPVFVR